ncbi:SprT family zinc-dependent metalloprotease [Desulfobacterales bacterium HSG17]|nr:SprT family zinc-dependent metalloprotease [Desulfobacterales bacterium HSG17]
MNQLTIGKRTIPYTIRENPRTRRITIHVTPETMEVVTPPDTATSIIENFLNRKKQWVFNKIRNMEESVKKQSMQQPQIFMTGAKIPYRGRMMKIHVFVEKVRDISISYKNGFYITIPDLLKNSDNAVKYRLRNWMIKQVEKDCKAFVRYYSKKLDLVPKGILVKKQKNLWGSCTKQGIIHINRQLAFAPKQILEYVVVHEICHLKHRNHTDEFWKLLGTVFPDWQYCKKQLKKHESEWGTENNLIT